MMEKCAGVVTDWLIRCEVVKETDKELYQYAVYSVFLSLSPLLLAAGFGAVFFWSNLHIYSVCIAIGIMLSAVLQIPCIFEKLVKMEQNDQTKAKNVVWRRKG